MAQYGRDLTIDTTMTALLTAIDDVADSDDEAFAVLQYMLDDGRLSVIGAWVDRAA